ncbi:FKBP-type peptidyl-prolyl cis-trans isomerase [Pedobacter jeongneungensis]|uniref:FKBP-type peptidyl-prolyl cis-trans isomerase n=1 Tax=Pedobacter jeongneungensis TaxID=947309 RepID=UPI00046970BB|nr:FKBP-type peptidyl-prolyl cis-trans isomerase [Pedobacter jeongneungensis]
MNKFTKLGLFTLLLATVVFSSCKKDYETIESVDDAAIKAYISKNNLTQMIPDPDKTGFYYQTTNPTDGTFFLNPDSVLYDVTVKSMNDGTSYLQPSPNGNQGNYVGYLNSFSDPRLSSLTFNIPAIRTAVLGLKPGGSARVLLPSYLAFGKNGVGFIPSNENLDLIVKTYTYRKQWLFDDDKIKSFLTTKGLTATKDASRIYYIVSSLGTGKSIDPEVSTVVINYTGRFLDGSSFDSNTAGTFSTVLSSTAALIQGWKILIPKFPAGTKLRMFIPSDLAYGPSGSRDSATGLYVIPRNAVLDFDIEIVSVTD